MLLNECALTHQNVSISGGDGCHDRPTNSHSDSHFFFVIIV